MGRFRLATKAEDIVLVRNHSHVLGIVPTLLFYFG